MPEFEGGMIEFQKYLMNNIKDPELNNNGLINTRLVIEFIIDDEGNVSMARILRSINPTLIIKSLNFLKICQNGNQV